MAVVDAFQHWVYEHPQAAIQPASRDACWAELWDRFMIGVDWSGLEDEKATGWQRKLHITQAPFYYIEYGLAQLGALQVWRNARQDQAGAVRALPQRAGAGWHGWAVRSVSRCGGQAGLRCGAVAGDH